MQMTKLGVVATEWEEEEEVVVEYFYARALNATGAVATKCTFARGMSPKVCAYK